MTDLSLTTVILTFNLVTSKLIGVICWWRPICTPSMKFLGPNKNNFSAHCHCDLSAQGHCDLDFRRTDLKTNRDLLLGMANLHTKYGVPRPNCSSVIERKPCFTSQGLVTLTFDLLTSTSIGVSYWSWPTCIPSIKFLHPSVLPLLSWNKCDRRNDGTGKNNMSPPCMGGDIIIGRYSLRTGQTIIIKRMQIYTFWIVWK